MYIYTSSIYIYVQCLRVCVCAYVFVLYVYIDVCVVRVCDLCTFCSMPFPYGTGAQVAVGHVLMIPEANVFGDMNVAAEVRRAKVCT